MLSAALLLTTYATPTHAVEAVRPLSPALNMIVARAWQDAEQGADDEKRHQDDLKRDREVGGKYAQQVDKELKASTDAESIARVQRIGKELSDIANATHAEATWGDKRLNPFEYQFKLVQDKDVNAFSLPGGYIYVYDGLIKFAESDDELAGVLAHEIAHAAFRHVATLQREESKIQAIQIPLILLSILTGGAGAAMNTLSVGSLVGTAVGNGWSVKAEEAADYGGFQYLRKSKYDPSGMLTFMERLAVTERRKLMGIDLGIYRTHPPSEERADSIEKYMKADGVPIRRSKVSSSCRVEVKPHEDGTVRLEFNTRPIVAFSGSDALSRADKAAANLNAFFDSEPELYELQVTPEGRISGRRQPLFELSHDDAVAAKSTVAQLSQDTALNVKRAMGSLSFRVWNLR